MKEATSCLSALQKLALRLNICFKTIKGKCEKPQLLMWKGPLHNTVMNRRCFVPTTWKWEAQRWCCRVSWRWKGQDGEKRSNCIESTADKQIYIVPFRVKPLEDRDCLELFLNILNHSVTIVFIVLVAISFAFKHLWHISPPSLIHAPVSTWSESKPIWHTMCWRTPKQQEKC